MEKDTVTTEMTVAEVLERWPRTTELFHEFKTACVGCAMAPFDTIADVIRIYELNGPLFLQELHLLAQEAEPEA